MSDPQPLFRFEPGTSPDKAKAAVLVVSMGGFIDAGHTQRLVTEHLLESHHHSPVATVDLDPLYDYRGRRPVMTFDRDRWTQYDKPALALDLVHALDGHPFLLLHGSEPDYQWERVVGELTGLIDSLGVELTVSVHGIPMAVPHTRPIGMTAHGTDARLLAENEPMFGEVQVPASFAALLEYRLGESGRDAIGFAVHIPHYLAQSEYPEGALAGLSAIADATGLEFDRARLAGAVETTRTAIAHELVGNEEVATVVAALERQYDAFARGRERQSLLAPDQGSVPSAEEIGAELEAFLKDVTDPNAGQA